MIVPPAESTSVGGGRGGKVGQHAPDCNSHHARSKNVHGKAVTSVSFAEGATSCSRAPRGRGSWTLLLLVGF